MLEKKYKFDKWTSPLHIDEIERTVVYDDDLNVVEIRDENLSAEARKFHRDLTRQKKELVREAKYKAAIESWKARPWYERAFFYVGWTSPIWGYILYCIFSLH